MISNKYIILFAVCAHANVDQPFMCVDLTFIWVLLEKGFGLKNGTKLRVSTIVTYDNVVSKIYL